MYSKSKSLQYVLFVCLIFFTFSVAVASAEVSTVLYDGNAAEFASPPDVIAFANTAYVTPPSEFQITAGGNIWRYNHVIALMEQGNWVEAKTTVETNAVGVQLWGDSNDGWARVLVDGEEVWTGDTYGNHLAGDAFIKYLEISGLEKDVHTIRVENMGVDGPGGSDHVTIYFFGLVAPAQASPTPTQISEKGLIAYYPFDGDARDYSGNNNHGTNNGATFVSGAKGQALSFDGTDDYVRSPVNINPDVLPQVTIVAWVKSDIESRTVISHDNVGYDRTIAIDNRGGGLGWSAFSGSGGVLGFHPVTIGEWTFIAAVYDQDAETVTLYVNDEMYTKKGVLSGGWDYTHIGSNPSYGGNFDGVIDEVRIYNSALTQSEINSIRTGTASSTPTSTSGSTPASTPGSTSIPTRGLVAYYPFDNDVRDYSGNNNHGTSQGNMAFSTGVVGSAAASFDGASYVEVQDSDSLDLTGDFTFSVWLNKIDAGVGGWAVVLSKGDTSSISATDSPYALFHYNGVYPSLRIDRQYISSDSATNYNEWYLVTVTREGNEFKFYINGELKDTKTSTAATPASTSKLLIGTDPPGVTEYFKGYMDDLRIYDYALSQSEASSIYGGGGTAPATGDVALSSTTAFSGLTFESRSKATGSSVQIPLTLYGVRENIGNMDMALRYDSSVLTATEVVKGSLTGDSIFDYNIIDGTIRISLADKDGFYGDGSVAQVRFDVIGSEGSFSDLDIVSLSANRADMTSVNIPIRDGVFKVSSKEVSKGDAEGDGGVLTALDALYALQMAVGKIPEDLTMDMNGDGSVTSIDARQILKSSAKIE